MLGKRQSVSALDYSGNSCGSAIGSSIVKKSESFRCVEFEPAPIICIFNIKVLKCYVHALEI